VPNVAHQLVEARLREGKITVGEGIGLRIDLTLAKDATGATSED
jgi:hypothetical protein